MTLAVALTWRLWAGGGQAFLLDMPWPEHFQLRDVLYIVRPDGTLIPNYSSGVPWMLLFAGLSHVLSAAVVQRLLLCGLLALTGLGMWLLARRVYALAGNATMQRWPAMFAGTVYTLNPYVIDRLWAGQWRVLAGYALAPVLAWSLVRYAASRTTKRLITAAVLYAVLPTLSLHWWFIASVAISPWLVWWSWRMFANAGYANVVRMGAIAGCIFMATNGWWLLHAFAAQSSYMQLQPTDVQYFPVTPTLPGGVAGTVLGLGGFWFHPFTFVGGTDGLWLWFIGALVACSVVGLRLLYVTGQRTLATIVALAGITAAVAAIIGGIPAAATGVQTVMQHIPGAVGLRELSKLVGILAFCYALAAPLGLQHLLLRRARTVQRAAWAVSMCSLLLLMAPAFEAAALQPARYPDTWRQANTYLLSHGAQRVLALPYVGYARLPFAQQRLIALPVQQYFDPVMLVGASTGNPALDGMRSQYFSPAATTAHFLTDGAFTGVPHLAIDHVLIFRASGQELMRATTGLLMVYENADIQLFAVTD